MKKIYWPVLAIVSIFVTLSIYSCGGGGGGTSATTSGTGNSATLTWDAPTTNADGTSLTDLGGYKVYYGTSSGNYTDSIDVGNVTTYTIDKLSPGTYYFAVTAYDIWGNESVRSDEVKKD